jgi:glycosyltransferase involved in cell wall biosynthesis
VNQGALVESELIIVDDGSTDGSREIARRYLCENVQLVAVRNSGIEAASNIGIKLARGDFVVRVDADDYLLPGYLEAILPKMKESYCSFSYSDYKIVDSDGEIVSEEKLPNFSREEIISRGDFLATGTMYRKAVIEKLKCYDESVKNCGLENYYLILKLLKSGHCGLHVPLSLFAYRRHDHNVSLQKREAIIMYGAKIFSEFGLGCYRTNAFHPYKLDITNG